MIPGMVSMSGPFRCGVGREIRLLAQNELSSLRNAQAIILPPVLEDNLAFAAHQFADEVPRQRTALLGGGSAPRRSR